jgi:hypothetical protein
MKKSNFSFPVYLVSLYLILSLFSCNKENPIEPPPPIPQDTADEYEWRAVEEGAGLWGEIFVSDTSHIYLFYDNGTCYRYDGANIFEPVNFGDPYFSVYRAGSIDNQNIYFAGFTYFSTSYSPITIKKMKNGNVIQTWISSEDSASDGFGYIVTGEDDVWYGKEISSCVYHLNSNTFTKYDLDSGLQYNYLWKDKFNDVFAFGNLYINNGKCIFHTYKFNGSRFEILSKDTLQDPFNIFCIYPCGNDLLKRSDGWGLSYFTGNNWIPFMNYPGIGIYKLGGNSKDTLINFALEYYPSTRGFSSYIWKGENWKREKKLAGLIPSGGYEGIMQVTIKIYRDNVYFPADFGNYKYLIIGKKIKNKKIYENKN